MSKPQTNKKLKNKKNIPKHKVNPLKPSMREKKRYMAYELMSDKALSKDADKALIAKIKELLGIFAAGKAGVMSVKYNSTNQKGILRVDRKFVDNTRSCFVMIKDINNEKVLIRTIKVSGMINKVKKEIE
ncbi:hypothetical protein KY348_03245 [Candidatus Woesearchaeota archaeon]|nr:hypothetical protein [Candidatus Woesearchaeota archaeon]